MVEIYSRICFKGNISFQPFTHKVREEESNEKSDYSLNGDLPVDS